MEGVQLKAEREHDERTALAWQTAIFALKGYAGELKNKKLSDYLIGKASKATRSAASDAVSFFHSMKAAGFPITIERVERVH